MNIEQALKAADVAKERCMGGVFALAAQALAEEVKSLREENERLNRRLSKIEHLRKAHERYETVRRMNPRQFSDMWRVSITSGKPFDELVDDMMPAMSGGDQGSEEMKRAAETSREGHNTEAS